MAFDPATASEEPEGFDPATAAPDATPRRGGTASELRGPGAFRGPPDDATGRVPLPDGVTPSNAGGGRGVVNPMPAAVQRADSAYQSRDEAINDAVDRIESGANPAQVFDAFGRMGISQQDIQARGQALGGRMFAPAQARPVASERLSGNPNAVDAVSPVEPNVAQDAGNAVLRGAEQFKQSVDAARFMAGGIDASQMAEQVRIGQRRMGALAPSSELQGGLDRLQDANKTGEWGPVLSAIAQPRNWPALASLVVESGVATGPAMVAGALATALSGGAGGMPVTAATSFAQEYAAALGDELEKRGVDASDPVKVALALQDPDVRAAIDERGRIRGAAVGAFDAISMGAAGAIGRTMRRMQQAGTLTRGRTIGGAAAGAAAEMGGGAGGEALAQAGVGESKKLDVAVEMLAEAPGGVVDVATSFLRPQSAMPPVQAKAEAIRRFDELAAAHGINSASVQRAKAATADMPADEVPGFLARLTDALTKRGLVAKPIDEQSLQGLSAALGDKPEGGKAAQAVDNIESILRRSGALPDAAAGRTPPVDTTGDANGQTEKEAQGLLKKSPGNDVTTGPGAPDFTGLDEAAHQAATSPHNDKPEPTDAQKDAGNYAKGHVRISGMDVSIENPKGSIRRAKADASDPWEVTMPAHYGYVRGTVGSDGDHVDLFIGDRGENGRFWIINQNHPGGTKFDEHKLITGVDSEAEAVALYKQSFADNFGEKVYGSVSAELDAPGIKAVLPRLGNGKPVPAVGMPQEAANDNQPDVAVPAGEMAGAGDGRSDQPGGSGRAVGSDAAAPGRVDQPAAASEGRREPPVAVAAGGQPDAALTPRILGSYGRTPGGATQIELRPNADGTLTPYTGKYAMIGHESGEPIRVPAEASDAEIVDAIRASGAVTNRDRFFGIKSNAAPAASGGQGESGGSGPVQPGAATPQDDAQDAQTRREALAQRATWLRKLIKCLDS